MTPNGHTTQFLIFQDNDAWRIASTDGRLSTFSAMYPCLDTAVSRLEEAGVSYRVVRFEDVAPTDRVEVWVIDVEEVEPVLA